MRERIVVIIISLLIVTDMLTGLLYNMHFGFYRFGIILKSAVILFTFIFCLPLLRIKSVQSIYIILGILFVCWFAGSFLSFFRNDSFDPGYSFVVLSRYILFLVLSCVFLSLRDSPSFEDKCGKILEVFFLVNNAFILIGFLFKIDLLSSYNPTGDADYVPRFGYKGLIYGANEVAGIYVLGLCYFYRENFVKGNDKKLLLIMTCVATMLTGTKATLIGLAAITIYYFLRYQFKGFLLLLIPVVGVLVYWFVSYWELIRTQYLSHNVELFESMDLINFLMSGRDVYIITNFEFMRVNWSFLNYIFGDAYLYSETDLLDLYYFFGLGALFYLYLYVKIYFLKDKSIDNVFNFMVLIAIAFTAGHIVQSAVVPVFMLLFVFSNRVTKRNEDPGNYRLN